MTADKNVNFKAIARTRSEVLVPPTADGTAVTHKQWDDFMTALRGTGMPPGYVLCYIALLWRVGDKLGFQVNRVVLSLALSESRQAVSEKLDAMISAGVLLSSRDSRGSWGFLTREETLAKATARWGSKRSLQRLTLNRRKKHSAMHENNQELQQKQPKGDISTEK